MAQPAGVYFQYRADDATATYATATTTAGIADSSGNARPNAIPSTSAVRPTLNTGGANGHSYLTFDGVDDRLTTSNATDTSMLTFLNNKPGGTISAVVRLTAGATGVSRVIAHIPTTTSAGRMVLLAEASNKWQVQGRRLDADTAQSTSSTGDVDTALHVITGVNDYTNAVQRLYVDGALVGTRSPFQTAGSTSATNSLAFNIGATTTPNSWFAGDMYEVLGYDRALTATEVADLTTFQQTRYGLAAVAFTGSASLSGSGTLVASGSAVVNQATRLRVLRAGVGTSGAATLRVLRAGVTTETSVVANAGAPITVDSLDVVVLSAEASSGNPTGYTWTQTSGPAVVLRPNGNVPRPEFTAPATDAGTTCTFSLAVTSGGTTSTNPAVATVTVRPHIEWLWSGTAWVPVLTEVVQTP